MSCITPMAIRDKLSGKWMQFPCGKCPVCVKRQISQWSFRLLQEERRSTSAHFITLTYATEHIPISPKGFFTVEKSDMQNFFKRLRKRHTDLQSGCDDKAIKYFAAAEYGGRTLRPHYHIILFNAKVELIQDAWAKDGKHIGAVHYGGVSGASVAYTLKYLMKKGDKALYKNSDRVKQFQLMSKGLGKEYMSPQMLSWHKADLTERMYCNLLDGKKVAMPRYYKDKIYSEQEREKIAFKARKRVLEEQEKEEMNADELYWHNKIQSHFAAFERMELKAIQNDKV